MYGIRLEDKNKQIDKRLFKQVFIIQSLPVIPVSLGHCYLEAYCLLAKLAPPMQHTVSIKHLKEQNYPMNNMYNLIYTCIYLLLLQNLDNITKFLDTLNL